MKQKTVGLESNVKIERKKQGESDNDSTEM